MTDTQRLEGDARYALDMYDHPAVQRVARAVLEALADPTVFVPDGYALVRKPELLAKGVPSR